MEFSEAHIQAVVRAGLTGAENVLDPDELHDAAFDALLSDAPVVKSWLANVNSTDFDDYDDYTFRVEIRGVPGAYFVTASEFDDEGVFSTVEDAISSAKSHFGEFFIPR